MFNNLNNIEKIVYFYNVKFFSIVKAIIKEGKCEGCLFIYFPNKNLFKGKVKEGILEEKGLYYENKS
jgi:hypothetical protein